jgi:type III restriction enzyme
MKLQFKEQLFQLQAVQAIVDCFDGQPIRTKDFTIDRSHEVLNLAKAISSGTQKNVLFEEKLLESIGYRNSNFLLNDTQILSNIQKVQRKNDLHESQKLEHTNAMSSVSHSQKMFFVFHPRNLVFDSPKSHLYHES